MGTASQRPNVTSTAATPTQSSSNFDDLWSLGLGGAPKTAATGASKSIKDLEREKAQASIWGTSQSQNRTFGALGGNAGGGAATAASGADDLLL